jgi:exodeoxyribonuclease-5
MRININGKIIELNQDQENALEAIKNWYNGKGMFFTLSGPAGSGKTTIVKEAIANFRKPLRISAPTHKACKVVAKSTGLFSVTIQALCGLRPDTKIDNVNQKAFVQKAEPMIRNYNIVIIDEASMLGKSILTLIMELALEHNTKVLFMGDIYQLPPVKEKVSSVFTHPDIEVFQLTKVERQQDSNPLMKVFDGIRSDIESKFDKFEHVTDLNLKGEGIEYFIEGQEFFKTVMETFKSEDYRLNPNHAKVLAWRNETVKAWNGYIRQQIYGQNAEPVMLNEVLMSYTHVYDEALRMTLIINSAEYKVTSLEKTFIHIDGVKIEIYRVLMQDIDDPIAIKVPMNIVVPEMSNYNAFVSKWHPLKEMAIRSNKWHGYNSFKHKFMLLEDLRDADGNLLVKKDFDYAYALTVHKSQGSTYTNVFVHENDLDNNRVSQERNQLKYVALSRPTTKAVVLSDKTMSYERSDISATEHIG